MIIDAHVHFYDPARPEGIPHPQPNRTRLYRTCLPEQLRAAAGWDISGVIAIECSHWLSDNDWLLDLARREPLIRGVVGNLDPTSVNFPDLVAHYAAESLFCGIRVRPALPLDYQHPRLRPNLEQLAAAGLTADFLVKGDDLLRVAALANELPSLAIMLDHLGQVAIGGPATLRQQCEGLARLAACPNVYCKVSGLTALTREQPAPRELSYYLPTLDFVWKAFGPDRLVFGSNWPPCEEFGGYEPQLGLTHRFLETKAPNERAAVFGGNAAAFYLARR